MALRRRVRPYGLSCFIFVAAHLGMVAAQKASNFHYAHIEWKLCKDTWRDGKVIPGFYDPAFPEVCADRTSGAALRKVGFTIHAAWPNGAPDSESMLQDYENQIKTFRDNCEGKLVYPNPADENSKPCYLSVLRGSNPQRARAIGWLQGLGQKALPVLGGLVDAAVSTTSRDFAAGVYNFVIERESVDFKSIHARFSFEIEFAFFNEYYTVYFEGCCRPSYLENNKELVFHVRTELYVNSDESTNFPLSSFKIRAPVEVSLKREGPGACNQLYCQPSDCYIKYQIQGFHEEPDFHEKMYFRKGSFNEMGLYKCMAKADPSNADSPLELRDGLCPAGTSLVSFTEPQFKMEDASQRLSNNLETVGGVVMFDMQQKVGVYHAVVVAEMLLENGVKLAQVLDQKVEVVDLPFNDQPVVYVPVLDDGEVADQETAVNILSGAADTETPSYPIKITPIEIQCGRPFFFLHKVGAQTSGGGPRDIFNAADNGLGTEIEFAFKDPDFIRPQGSCEQFVGQNADFIDLASTVPKGLNFSKTVTYPNGVAMIKLQWTPVCEDRSQIGMFEICFLAKDKSAEANFKPSYSVPSPFPRLWTPPDDSIIGQMYAPTCIFVESKQPANNPRPVSSTKDPETGKPRIFPVCCGYDMPQNAILFPKCIKAGWKDEAGEQVKNEYVLGCAVGETCQKYELVVAAQSDNDFSWTDIRFRYPDATSTKYFSVSQPKYGCDEYNFDECVNNTKIRNKVARKLTVAVSPNIPNVMRICYQSFQIAPSAVNLADWQQLYNGLPTSQSCVTCFMLNVINSPIWPLEFKEDNSKNIIVPVGTTRSIKVTARNPGSGRTNIFLLADPGAPDGSQLLDLKQESASEYSRTLTYTPTVDQAGLQSTVCFTASTVQDGAADPVDSEMLCYVFEVWIEKLLWYRLEPKGLRNEVWIGSSSCLFETESGICLAQGVIGATVGCKLSVNMAALTTGAEQPCGDLPCYSYKLRMQQYPQCSNCYSNGGASSAGVNLCSASKTRDCCGDNICNGAETGFGCPEDCPPDNASLEPGEYDTTGYFTFMPLRHQQGREVLMCIEAYTEAAGTAVVDKARKEDVAPSFCVVFQVESCRYCVPEGATLTSIATHYLLNVDWLRLYNTNPDVENPDVLLQQKQIQVGPLYSVGRGDTLLSVAATMKTTVKMLIQNNPQIADQDMLKTGSKICVLLCSAAS